ncbi:UDP-N-acetylglucosamine 2-epimerase (non-hydrolyzing) [Rhodobacterales bacterium FZCC0188]|nr:UDP-N-acetylglucosamine 2-epimerase (non-hydrolyzing) [Rhodobacterales bacterium FZCC0188]
MQKRSDSLKVMTIVGTRPEVIRLSRVINALEKSVQHILVHTGQNFDHDLSGVFFTDLNISKPTYQLQCGADTPSASIAKILLEVEKVVIVEQPDAVLILGDTNSCLAALVAKKHQIPIFHMEAGNRCFDMRVPEETNRRLVDHMADINLTYSQIARSYLISEGIRPELIINTGSPMKEVLDFYHDEIEASDILERLSLQMAEYFLVSVHRAECVDHEQNLSLLLKSLNALGEKYDKRIVVSTHPRTRKAMNKLDMKFNKNISFENPFGYFDYVKLQKNAFLVLSDSGTITEEASILGFPALNIRSTHERPEGMEEGAVMLVGLEWPRISQAVELCNKSIFKSRSSTKIVSDYDVDNVSDKVVKTIISYTDYVNRYIWRKTS